MKLLITLLTLIAALYGYMADAAWLVALANMVLGFAFVAVDVAGLRQRRVSVLTFFALASGVAGLGNWVVIQAVSTGNVIFQGYGDPKFYLQAAFLTYVGSVLPHLGGWVAQQMGERGRSFLPMVFFMPARWEALPWVLLMFATVALMLPIIWRLPDLGRLTAVVMELPVMAVFVMARCGYKKRNRAVIWAAFALAGTISWRALLFAYLRGEILGPWLAFAVGALLGRPRVRTLLGRPFLVVYVIATLFFAYFAAMSTVRDERVYGRQRIQRLTEVRADMTEGDEESEKGPIKGPLERRSTVNKVSRIFALVEKNGFYDGKSMAYYRYVFIPRFIWPTKPLIQKGGWFANELGLARAVGGGRYSNAINMTIPGELYLNFGWVGTLVGCIGMGFVIMLIWQATGFWDSADNIPGLLLSFRIISRALAFLGPDMQSLVGYINLYLVFWAISVMARHIWSSVPAHDSGLMPSPRHLYPPQRRNPRTETGGWAWRPK